MDLLRQWRTRLLGGAAAAVTVPVAIVGAALAIGVAGGEIGGLRALGQALTGPSIPVADALALRAGQDVAGTGDLLSSAVESAGPSTTSAGPAPVATPAPARRRPAAGGGSGSGGGGSGGGDGSFGVPAPSATAPPASTQPNPAPAPTEPPSTVRQVGDTVKSVTDQVPIAGEPAGEVVDLLVETAEQLPLP